jgi:hypothetical protein
MNVTHQTLVEQIVDEVEGLPENLRQEVLDFIGYLRIKYSHKVTEEREGTFLDTFGSWKDEREPEEIVQDIYAHRTISELEPEL